MDAVAPQPTLMELPDPATRIFNHANARYNRPAKVVTLGHYYPQTSIRAAKTLVKEAKPAAYRADSPFNPSLVRDHIAWTRLINALNDERQWPLTRLYEMLDPMLEPGIAIAAVLPHRAYQAFWPLRTLAQRLADNGRIDATACLVRHTTIRRIIYGGASNRALHRQTIQVEEEAQVQGQRVLLLDDMPRVARVSSRAERCCMKREPRWFRLWRWDG